MKFFKSGLFHKNQSGFSMVEMLAAVVITGVISLGVAIASVQIINQTSRDTNIVAAGRHAMNAINWISRDALMAQAVEGCDDFPEAGSLVFSWKGWDNNLCTANYTVTNGNLNRVFSDGSQPANTFIAGNIYEDADLTWCASDNGTITIKITAFAGEGARTVDVSKSRVITNRSEL